MLARVIGLSIKAYQSSGGAVAAADATVCRLSYRSTVRTCRNQTGGSIDLLQFCVIWLFPYISLTDLTSIDFTTGLVQNKSSRGHT